MKISKTKLNTLISEGKAKEDGIVEVDDKKFMIVSRLDSKGFDHVDLNEESQKIG